MQNKCRINPEFRQGLNSENRKRHFHITIIISKIDSCGFHLEKGSTLSLINTDDTNLFSFLKINPHILFIKRQK